MDELRKLHKSVRGYPIRMHPDDGHTYTDIVEGFCEYCGTDQPCVVNTLLDFIDAAKILIKAKAGPYQYASWPQKLEIDKARRVWESIYESDGSL